jgi:hypothetical protein
MLHIMQAEGLGVERLEFAPDGKVVIIPRDASSATTIEARPTDNKNEWEV